MVVSLQKLLLSTGHILGTFIKSLINRISWFCRLMALLWSSNEKKILVSNNEEFNLITAVFQNEKGLLRFFLKGVEKG